MGLSGGLATNGGAAAAGGDPQPVGTRISIMPSLDYTALAGAMTIDGNTQPLRLYTAGNVNDSVRFNGIYLVAGTWKLRALVQTGPANGIGTVLVGAVSAGTIDCYSAGTVANVAVELAGIVVAASGTTTVTVTTATKNASASSYFFPLQWLALTRTA